MKVLLAAGLLGALLYGVSPAMVHAQSDGALERAPRQRVAPPRQRIIITPSYNFHRQCTGGYREVYRPFWHETVVTPTLQCSWVRGG